MFGQKKNNNEEKAKDPIFPPDKKIVSLSGHVFERRTSTGSEPFSLYCQVP